MNDTSDEAEEFVKKILATSIILFFTKEDFEEPFNDKENKIN